MTRFLGWKEFKEKVQSDIPTVLYENTNITTTFPNVDITTSTLPITLNQDCTKFKRLLVEGIIAIKNCNPTSTTTNLYDIFTTTDVINPEYGKMFALQDWFLYSDSTSSNDDHFAYCFRLVCKISNDGLSFEPYISADDGGTCTHTNQSNLVSLSWCIGGGDVECCREDGEVQTAYICRDCGKIKVTSAQVCSECCDSTDQALWNANLNQWVDPTTFLSWSIIQRDPLYTNEYSGNSIATTDVKRSGWKRFGEVKNNYINTTYQYGYPIAITKVIGFNNLK